MEIKKLPESRAEISGEIAAEEFERAHQEVFKNTKAELEIPGFRKGMAPDELAMSRIGEEKLLWEAAREAINKRWPNIIKEAGIELVGKPNITITKIARGNPLGFKIIVSILEPIALPDYRSIARRIVDTPQATIIITDDEINKVFSYVKEHNKNLPPDADENKLKSSIRQNLEFEKHAKERDKRRMSILEAIARETQFAIPDVVIEAEIEKMLGELCANLAQMGLKLEQYLEHVKKTEDNLRNDWKPEAKQRVTFGLILREIMKKENIMPDLALVAQKTDEMLRTMDSDERAKASPEAIADYVRGRIQHEMVFDLLEKKQ